VIELIYEEEIRGGYRMSVRCRQQIEAFIKHNEKQINTLKISNDVDAQKKIEKYEENIKQYEKQLDKMRD
jgi:hypothetical protein